MFIAQRMPTSASETTIEMRPKARPIARVIGPWVASLEPDLDQDSAQLASSAQLAITPKPKPTGGLAAGGVGTDGAAGGVGFRAAEATPGPVSAARAAITVTIAAPLL